MVDIVTMTKAKRAYNKKRSGLTMSKKENQYFMLYMEHWLGEEITNKIKGLFLK